MAELAATPCPDTAVVIRWVHFPQTREILTEVAMPAPDTLASIDLHPGGSGWVVRKDTGVAFSANRVETMRQVILRQAFSGQLTNQREFMESA